MSARKRNTIAPRSGSTKVPQSITSAQLPERGLWPAPDALVAAIERLYRQRMRCTGTIALHEPWFRGNEWGYVKDCIDTGWVSTVGSYVDRFETQLASYCGAAHAIAVANGTVGLHVTLHALGVGADDLVVCPAISFVATANSIAHCGAEPLFLDVGPDRLALEPDALDRFFRLECERTGPDLRHGQTGRRIAAAMVVHLFGHPAEADRLATVCAAHNVPLVEDAAEALGSRHRGRHCGTFGSAGVLSFNGNKIVTTGGGGAILTDDPSLAQKLKHLTTTARVTHAWEYDHDEVGFNYRMPNINAALGCAQLEQLEDFLARKRGLAAEIAGALGGVPGVTVLREPQEAVSNFWLNTLLLDHADMREEVLRQLNARGIQARPCWRLLPDLPMYRAAPVGRAGLDVARDRVGRLVNIPSSAKLGADEQG
jgi:perosamine synthetase